MTAVEGKEVCLFW